MAIKHKPTYSDAYYNRGICLNALNRQDEAIASYDSAIKYNPTNSDAYFKRGNCLYDLNRLEEAHIYYKKLA